MRRLRKWFAHTKAKGHGGPPVFYDRLRHDGFGATRQYHVFGLVKVVTGSSESFWRLIIGSHAFAFGYKNRKQAKP